MRLISFILLLFISFTALAQIGPINIHLTSGKIISTHYAYLYSGYSSYLRIHEKRGEKISIDQVDHIEGKDQYGKYRYFIPIRLGNAVWAERGYASDRIVIYHTDIVTGTMAANYKPKSCLYTKDGGQLQKLKLKYLKRDLADCPASLEHLRKGKNIGKAQAGVRVASISLLIAGFISMVNDSNVEAPGSSTETNSSPDIPPSIIVGAVAAWIPILMENSKREKYLDALKAYQ